MGSVYLGGPPYADEYRTRAAALVRAIGWEPTTRCCAITGVEPKAASWSS